MVASVLLRFSERSATSLHPDLGTSVNCPLFLSVDTLEMFVGGAWELLFNGRNAIDYGHIPPFNSS